MAYVIDMDLFHHVKANGQKNGVMQMAESLSLSHTHLTEI